MNPSVSQLERRLRSVERRLRITRALDESARFGLLAAPIGLGVAVARTLVPHGAVASLSPRHALVLVVAPAALGAVAGAAFGALASVSRRRAASLAEDRANLGVAFTTALEIDATEHAWRPVVLAEAEDLARSLEPSLVAPLGLPRRARTVGLVLATALAVFFLPVERLRASTPEPEKTVSKPALDALAKAGQQLRQSSEALPQGESRKAIDEAGKELRTFLSDLESGELGKRDALARLGEAEERIRVERAREDARASVREALARDKDLAGIAKAGGGAGSPEKAKLDALAAKLATDPRAREAAKEALQAAARGAEATPELRESLEKAAHALEAARGPEDKAKLAPALADLARTMAEQPSTAQDRKARTELAKAHQALEEARAAVAEEKLSPETLEKLAKAAEEPPPHPSEGPDTARAETLAKLAEKIPPELLRKALEGAKKPPQGTEPEKGQGTDPKPEEKPPISPEDAKKLLDKLPQETLEKLAKAAQEAAPGKMEEAGEKLPDDVKDAVQEAAKEAAQKPDEPKDGEERGIPPEALAKMAEMIPPELIAKLMKMKAESAKDDPASDEPKGPPPISPEDAQKVLEKLSPRTLEKLAKAAIEAQKNAPAPKGGEGGEAGEGTPRPRPGGISPEQAQAIAKKLSPETLSEIQKAAGSVKKAGSGEGSPGTGSPGTGAPGPGSGGTGGSDSGSAGVLGRQGDTQKAPESGNPTEPSRVIRPGDPEGPRDDKDPLVKNKPQVAWDRPPEQLPVKERDALRAGLERKRVPRSYERSVREYFDLGK